MKSILIFCACLPFTFAGCQTAEHVATKTASGTVHVASKAGHVAGHAMAKTGHALAHGGQKIASATRPD